MEFACGDVSKTPQDRPRDKHDDQYPNKRKHGQDRFDLKEILFGPRILHEFQHEGEKQLADQNGFGLDQSHDEHGQ